MADKLLNGSILGAIVGILIVSSSISWIQSFVTTITNLIPADYQFQYISYVVFGVIGLLVGYLLDKY